MDLLFVYEDKIAQDEAGNYYTGSAFSQAVFDRYLAHFDHIILLMRRADVRPDDRQALSRMNRIESDRISVVLLPNISADMKSFLSLDKRRRFKRTVIENITPERAVIIRAPSGSGTIAARYCKRIGKTFLVEAVGCPWDSLWNHSWRGKILAPMAWRSMRYVMRQAPYAIYVTKAFLQRRYPTRGVSASISDVELKPADEAVLTARLERQAEHREKMVIGTAGAVNVRFKGQQYVIRALAKLKKQGRTDLEYRIAGGGDQSYLKALAERLGVAGQVVFEGSLPHHKMFEWLDGLDLYIQPSLVESTPRALVEAMSRGLPAFGSRVGGLPELLDGSAIFPAKDEDAIMERIQKLSTRQMSEMAQANFARAQGFRRELMEQERSQFYGKFAAAAEELRI